MSECIVDALEAVEIETEHGDEFRAPLAAEGRFHPLVERYAVRQIGERIVVRQVLDFFLGEKSLGDVFVGGDPAAVRHRLVYSGDDPAIGQVYDLAEGRSFGDCGQDVSRIWLGVAGSKAAGCCAVIEDVPKAAAKSDDIRR